MGTGYPGLLYPAEYYPEFGVVPPVGGEEIPSTYVLGQAEATMQTPIPLGLIVWET